MKKRLYSIFYFILVSLVISLASCTKEREIEGEKMQANVILRLENLTKSTGSDHTNQINDNTINNLTIFVFNQDASKTLETFKYIKVIDGIDLNNISFITTTGYKDIFVIANSHDSSQWSGVLTKSQFLAKASNLANEELRNFAMSGSLLNTLVTESNSINLNLKRIVAKVVLNSLKTSFENTPYSGYELSNVKIYLTNVVKESAYIEDQVLTSFTYANFLQHTPLSYNNFKISGALYDNIIQNIGATPYTTSHHFYAYENRLISETSEQKFTRLIIEADLNGHTYYYPININKTDFGSDNNDGIRRNTVYNLSVTIMRPGSSSPEVMIEKGTVIATITVSNWQNEIIDDIIF